MTDREKEKLTDPSDIATQLEMDRNEGLLNEARSRARRTQEAQADGSYLIVECTGCGNDIGDGRLKHSIKNTICIGCATAAERKR